jgi:hypothetical protein
VKTNKTDVPAVPETFDVGPDLANRPESETMDREPQNGPAGKSVWTWIVIIALGIVEGGIILMLELRHSITVTTDCLSPAVSAMPPTVGSSNRTFNRQKCS